MSPKRASTPAGSPAKGPPAGRIALVTGANTDIGCVTTIEAANLGSNDRFPAIEEGVDASDRRRTLRTSEESLLPGGRGAQPSINVAMVLRGR